MFASPEPAAKKVEVAAAAVVVHAPKPPAADDRGKKRPVTRMYLWTMQNRLR